MKKKISILLCVLALTLGLAGCGNTKAMSYDKDTLSNACEQVFTVVESGSITPEQVTSMSDWNQGYLMAQFESQTGAKMEADAFITAMEAWQSSLEECGDYIGHGDYQYKATTSSVVVSTEAEFSDRKADLVFTFDKNLELESFNVDAHYDTGEILEKAGLNTLLGMGTVFAVLIFMSLIISLMKYIPALLNGTKKKDTAPAEAASAPAVVPVAEEVLDDSELIAVIAAAIAASEGTSTDGFVVRSVKRRKSNKWNA